MTVPIYQRCILGCFGPDGRLKGCVPKPADAMQTNRIIRLLNGRILDLIRIGIGIMSCHASRNHWPGAYKAQISRLDIVEKFAASGNRCGHVALTVKGQPVHCPDVIEEGGAFPSGLKTDFVALMIFVHSDALCSLGEMAGQREKTKAVLFWRTSGRCAFKVSESYEDENVTINRYSR